MHIKRKSSNFAVNYKTLTKMKRLLIFASSLMMILSMASCNKDKHDADSFIGTWGAKHIEYYNIDYAGNPIEATILNYNFTPGDLENGIDLVFKADRTGKMVDRSRDTLYFNWNAETETYDSILPCIDTVIITNFEYSYNKEDKLLFMKMMPEPPYSPYIYQMKVTFIDDNTIEYVNEYDLDYVEKATLVRYSNETRGAKSSSKPANMKRHPKSLFSNY